MSVNWYWKDKLGEIKYKDLDQNKVWKLQMFGGNVMCAFIYRYKNEKGQKYYTFFTFLNDKKHAKLCFKDTRLEDFPLGNHKVLSITLNVNTKNKYSNKEMLWLAQQFVKMKYKVILK